MSREYRSRWTKGGSKLQAGIERHPQPYSPTKAGGMLHRGVVVTVYTIDDPNHPAAVNKSDDETAEPVAVYCDVLTYSDNPGARWGWVPKVLVSQDVSGIHRGRIRKPRAATLTISGNTMDLERLTDPSDVDGDHVLIGYIDDRASSPVLLRYLPHPGRDVGNQELDVGHRTHLLTTDGDPDFIKHHGTFFGIDDNGDYVADSTYANDGTLDEGALEKAPPTDGKGSHRYRLEFNAEHQVTLLDMADPTAPVEKVKLTLNQTSWHLEFEGETLSIAGQDATATFVLGDGAVTGVQHAKLKALYVQLKAKLDAADAHTHVAPMGATGPPLIPVVAPVWDGGIEAPKISFPDG